jgi:hypothetical protein
MGGNAFAETLFTPRMPLAVYLHVRDQTLAIMRKYYRYAESPIEAPKSNYGDVDILVAEPLADVEPETIAEVLGAKEFKKTKGSSTTNIALPWPVEVDDCANSQSNTHITSNETHLPNDEGSILLNGSQASGDTHETPPSSNIPYQQCTQIEAVMDKINVSLTEESGEPSKATETAVRFIQLDLHDCPTHQRMRWELFHQAHGDFWNIIGTIIRPFGLTASNSGFYLRIAEVERYNKEMGKVKLTEDPAMVLDFLGMDIESKWPA